MALRKRYYEYLICSTKAGEFVVASDATDARRKYLKKYPDAKSLRLYKRQRAFRLPLGGLYISKRKD